MLHLARLHTVAHTPKASAHVCLRADLPFRAKGNMASPNNYGAGEGDGEGDMMEDGEGEGDDGAAAAAEAGGWENREHSSLEGTPAA